eukprot:CAMPEP_0116038988 /NCGR_PEP_ID=MMETSP0321-20121206/23220_1 /TAXON_ID=163516 /ORGANISM="Leptocylindrus danicus var. danicus, Strain B650" /LENGTH=169 /DNA_ID=CAMNT_0003517975 /DNA_START=434 /DNA_END=943 /DNA_ORIENTATION=+
MTWILDSVPGTAHGSVDKVISALSSMPQPIESKQYLMDHLCQKGIDPSICAWMTTNLERDPNVSSGFRFKFDLKIIHDILADFPRQDFIKILRDVSLSKEKIGSQMNIVRAGKNESWTNQILRELLEIEESCKAFRTHVLHNSGHWVHVDDLEGLLGIMHESLNELKRK